MFFEDFELIPIPEDTEDDVDDIFTAAEKRVMAFKNTMQSLGLQIGQVFSVGFSQLFARIQDSEGAIVSFGDKFKEFGKQFLEQITAMIIQAAVFAAIMTLLTGGSFTGKAAVGGTNFMSNFAGGLGIKGFADGGRPPLNRMSLVGENGPELFNPGSQSGTIIPNHAMGGTTIPDVRISGNDLLIVFNKAQRRKNLR